MRNVDGEGEGRDVLQQHFYSDDRANHVRANITFCKPLFSYSAPSWALFRSASTDRSQKHNRTCIEISLAFYFFRSIFMTFRNIKMMTNNINLLSGLFIGRRYFLNIELSILVSISQSYQLCFCGSKRENQMFYRTFGTYAFDVE